MSDWDVLGLSQNPAPGDPGQSRQLAQRLLSQADLLHGAGSKLSSIASSSAELAMAGDYAAGFQNALDDLPHELSLSERAYRRCGQALATFSSSLEQAQAAAGTALRQGRDADAQFTGAVQQIRNLMPVDRHLIVSSGLGLSEWSVDSATTGLEESLRDQILAAARRARQAEADRNAARQLALQAATLRGDAESRCANEIDDSLHAIENEAWWEKAWAATAGVVSWPFTSWDHFITSCEVAGAVLGVVAIFLSGPIGWAIAAAAIAAGGVSLADTAIRFSKGEAGPPALGLAVLGVIPGLGAGGKLTGLLAKLSREIPIAGTVFGASTRVAARIGSAARGAASTAWPRIASTFGKEREEAIAIADRTLGGDPIDLASGHVVMQQTDVVLPGLLELAITRTHLSSYRAGRWFGPSWASFLDQRLELDGERVLYAAADATLLCFPRVPEAGQVIRPTQGPRLELALMDDVSFQITDPRTGLTSLFQPRSQSGDGALPLVAVTDRNGHRISLDYTPDGELMLVRHSGGYRLGVDTRDNRIVGLRLLRTSGTRHLDGTPESDDGTEILSYRYDGAGRLSAVIISSGLALLFTYDPDGRLARWEDRNGTWYQYSFDEQGRCVRTSGSGRCLERQLVYDEAARTTVEINSLGEVTTYQLNALSQVVAVTDPIGNVTRTEWDAFDHRLAIVDAAGGVTRFEYDDDGNLAAVQRPGGATTRVRYNTLRKPVSVTMADGTVWRRFYDAAGNLLRSVDPLGATTSYEYDAAGRLTAITDPRGTVTRLTTNAAGLVTSVTDPAGATTVRELDSFGRVVSIRDAAGDVTRAEYSPEGWLSRLQLPAGAAREWRYDPEGNVVAAIDEQGQVTSTGWTNFDLPASRTLPDGSRLTYSYDTELRLIAVTNAAGQRWRFEYDAAGRMVRETDVNGRTISYRHDALGRVVERVNGAGESMLFEYDAAGNVVRKQSAGAVTRYQFDAMGQLVRATSPDVDLLLERDLLGRVVAETSGQLTSHFVYDAAGFRIGRFTPTGATSTWTYDVAGHAAELTSAGRSVAFARDVLGREVERSLRPDMVLQQGWGAGYQLLDQSVRRVGGPAVAGRSYGYDIQGRLSRVQDQLRGRTDYELDPLGRVTAAQSATGTELFSYDPAGTVVTQASPWRYQHDRQGRMTLRQHKTLSSKARNWHYSWDAEDRLVAVTTPEGYTWRYRYDGLGRRVAKQRIGHDGGVVEEQRFVWDGYLLAEQITVTGTAEPGEEAEVSAISWDWLPGDVQPVTQTHRVRRGPSGDQAWFDQQFFSIVTDLIGTPSELVDDDGQVAWRNQVSLWGVRPSPAPGDIDCPLAFPGQYRDDETGLHYNLLRYYDPVAASFVSPDPLGLLAGPNPHTYVPNPTTHIDPLGLTPYRAAGGNSAQRTIPLGFRDADDFAAFSADLRNGLLQAGHHDVTPIFQGSSVTGYKFTTGAPFDVGRRSDYDISLASHNLLERAKDAGIGLRGRSTRTGPLQPAELQRLGILDLADKLSLSAGRDVHFMIYGALPDALSRSAAIMVP